MKTIQSLASEMSEAFETKRRDNGESFVLLKDGVPTWMQGVCRAAHNDAEMLPDDWRYSFIADACSELENAEDIDDIHIEADCYTSELTRWLGSRADRVEYLTQALQEFGEAKDGFQLLALAQYLERTEVLEQVRTALAELAEEGEAA